MIKTIVVAILLVVMTLAACKKDKAEKPFSPIGYWRGYMHQFSSAIVNRPDGTSRFYLQIPSADTSTDYPGKYDGTYEIKNNMLIGKYNYNGAPMILETHKVTPAIISGYVVTSGGNALPFEFRKQP